MYSPTEYTSLKHPPLVVDDTIGKLLETKEGFTGAKERLLHDCLKTVAIHGYSNMPLSGTLKMGWAMLRYHLSFEDGVALFGKYVGNWGGSSTVWRFDGIKNGEVVISRTLAQSANLDLHVTASNTTLYEGDSYDMAEVRVRVLDEYGNAAPFNQCALQLETSGCIEIAGPKVVTCEGGATGIYVRTTGKTGKGKLVIKASGFEDKTVEFEVRKETK